MAIVLGTSSGFCTSAPSSDPGGSGFLQSSRNLCQKDTSPAGAVKITEIGWWCDNATTDANYEVGIYSDNSGNPQTLLQVSRTHSKGTDAGWKVATGLNLTISPETIYWIAVQCDSTSANSNNASSDIGSGTFLGYWNSQTTLATTWAGGVDTFGNIIAIYALTEAAEGLNPKVKVSGTFSTKKTLVKIGGTFAEKPVKVKVSGTFQ